MKYDLPFFMLAGEAIIIKELQGVCQKRVTTFPILSLFCRVCQGVLDNKIVGFWGCRGG